MLRIPDAFKDAFQPEYRMRSILIAIILALSSAFFVGYFYFFSAKDLSSNDFFVFWAMGRFLQDGTLAGAYDPATFYAFERGLSIHSQGGLPFVYPPHAALIFRPFADLSLGAALAVWDMMSLTVYLAGAWQVFRPRTLAMSVALIAPSTVGNLIYSQTGLLTGGLTILGFSLLKRSPILSGVAFGLLSIKPQLAALPLLVLLLSGNRKASLAAAVTILLLVLVSLAAFQPGAWAGWMETLSGFSTAFSTSSWHYQNGVTVYFTLLNLGASRYVAIAVQGAVSVLVLWQLVRIVRSHSGPLAIMAALIGVFLATPYALIYDLPVVSVVCLMMIVEGFRSGFRDGELLVVATAWCLPLILIATDAGNPALALSVLVGLFALILRRIKTQMPLGAAQALQS